MNFKIGDYIENKMKEKDVTKTKLYEEIKEIFHPDQDYVTYKGFMTRFYTKFYATDLLEITYLLGIDLNKMRDEIINKKKNNELFDLVLSKSMHAKNFSDQYLRWFDVEDGIVYLVWYKQLSLDMLDYAIEMYDLSKGKIIDITFLKYKAILAAEKDLNNKTIEDKLKAIKLYNKKVYDKIESKNDLF